MSKIKIKNLIEKWDKTFSRYNDVNRRKVTFALDLE